MHGAAGGEEDLRGPATLRGRGAESYVESFAAFYAKDEVTGERLRNELCQQASRAGADAIIELTAGNRPYSRLVQVGPFEVSEGGNTKKLTGIAIRYDGPEP